jgi:hypothetical protein
MKGRKPKPAALRAMLGNPGKRPLPAADPLPAGSIERPTKLNKAVGAMWDTFVARAFWLTWADGPKALMWCHLQAEYQKSPTAMIASRIAQLRALGSELGFDQAARIRMGVSGGSPAEQPRNPASKYLDRDPNDRTVQ